MKTWRAVDWLARWILGEEFLWRRQVRRRVRQDDEANRRVVIVHQMGKVGSQAVYRCIRGASGGRAMAVHHTHFLSERGLDFLAGLYRDGHGSWRAVPEKSRRFVVAGRALGRELRSGVLRRTRCSVVSLVRDPVATNVSGFFHNWAWWPKDLAEACEARAPGWRGALKRHFLRGYPHELPATWFDMEMLPVFGIDIYAEPFPREAGWKIYRGDAADLLMMKAERLGACAGEALGQFLGISAAGLTAFNSGADKPYAGLYAEFLEDPGLPDEYLDRAYGARHARHFYGDEEIADFRRRWS